MVETLRDKYRIFALDWCMPEPGLEDHDHVRFLQVDIGNRNQMLRLGRELAASPPRLILHLAAHYEFEQVDEAPYWRTNVEGLRNVLDAAVAAGIPGLLFASSLAASRFPRPGQALTEASEPDGEHIYARTKRAGEEMLKTYRGRIKSVVIRFAAMYSDYCEYPPLFKFLETWLSSAWNRRMLGGRGRSAIPYLHIKDAARFVRTVVSRFEDLEDEEILVASPDECTSHLELFRVATEAYFGAPARPILIPRPLVRPGIRGRMILGRILGRMPFERPWMAAYVDQEMRVNAAGTRARLGFAPRPRLAILERMPLLVENLRAYPAEWIHRNQGLLQRSSLRPNMVVHCLIQRHRDDIARRLSERLTSNAKNLPSYQRLNAGEHAWNHRLALAQLMEAVRTRVRKPFVDYCADLAARRFGQGFSAGELSTVLRLVEEVVLEVIQEDSDAVDVESSLYQDIRVTMRFAVDAVEEVFEDLAGEERPERSEGRAALDSGRPPSESALEGEGA